MPTPNERAPLVNEVFQGLLRANRVKPTASHQAQGVLYNWTARPAHEPLHPLRCSSTESLRLQEASGTTLRS